MGLPGQSSRPLAGTRTALTQCCLLLTDACVMKRQRPELRNHFGIREHLGNFCWLFGELIPAENCSNGNVL